MSEPLRDPRNEVTDFTHSGCLVLDEADRLLDQGFRNELMKILNALPNRTAVPRQTLLFSATIPQSVHQVLGP